MPRGVYPRKRSKQVNKQIKPLIKNFKGTKLTLTVISTQDGLMRDTYVVRSFFRAFQIVIEEYQLKGISIEDVRIS